MADDIWKRLETECVTDYLASHLKNEYPQVVAMVLSQVSPELAAKILDVLPQNFAMEVIIRVNSMCKISNIAIDTIRDSLENYLAKSKCFTTVDDTHGVVASIFDNTEASKAFLEQYEERNRQSAEIIKSKMKKETVEDG